MHLAKCEAKPPNTLSKSRMSDSDWWLIRDSYSNLQCNTIWSDSNDLNNQAASKGLGSSELGHTVLRSVCMDEVITVSFA